MKLYGIRFAKGFKYGTQEAVFRTQKGNSEIIPEFPFFYYMAEHDGKYLLFDTGFRDGQLAADMGVILLKIEGEIERVFDSFPEIDTIFLTHSHWDHMNNIDLYPNATLIMSKQTYEVAMSEGIEPVKARLQKTRSNIFLVDEEECYYHCFHFAVIGGHTPDSSVIRFQIGKENYCITGDECYLCDNIEHNIPIGISFCGEKNEMFIQNAHSKGWIPLPFHDAVILEKYDRLTENIVRIF